MKKIVKISAFFSLLLFILIAGCSKSDITPQIESPNIDNYDIIQLTNERPDLPVIINFAGNEVNSIKINIYKKDSTAIVATNTITNVRASSGTIKVSTPFPFPDLGAQSGMYKVEYVLGEKSGTTTTKSYMINLLNNKQRNLCTFPNDQLPAGKNTWIRVTTTQPLAANEDLYVTGSFEVANGGAGDWSGGGVSMFKMTKLSDQCFMLPLNLTAAHEFKFTLGSWDKEALDNVGGTPANFKWNGTGTQSITIYNWKGKPLLVQSLPQVLPEGGIVQGRMSVIADVNSSDPAIKYYLVEKGGNLTDKTYPMVQVMEGATATTKVIGSVPKDSTKQYVVVRDVNGTAKQGVNEWGYEKSVRWDGMTNPVNVSLPFFMGDAAILPVPANLFIVGDATAGGWNNPVPVPSQQLVRVSAGKFEATLALSASKAYVFLPVNGSWDQKFGGSGKLSGTIVPQGNNIPSPDVAGNYKITVDFTTGVYSLVKQ